MSSSDPLKNAFLAQLRSIDTRSREFPSVLTKVLASQEGMNGAMSLQGDDALALVDILDQAFDAPDVEPDLREKCVRVLRRVCGSQTILPRSCLLSDNTLKEDDISSASGGSIRTWKGLHNGNRVCIKVLPARQRLFQEIVIWRRLSHPNVLPVLGVSPKLLPLFLVTEWMADGNIMDFISMRPEVNCLRLLAEVASGLEYLHSMDIVHSDLQPTNILIGHDLHPRLTNYGLIAILPYPTITDCSGETLPSDVPVRYMAPELLSPSDFGLKSGIPTKESDVYAFGMATYQIVTGQQPFPEAHVATVMHDVVTGERPDRPPDPNRWLSDHVWDFISKCWSPSWDGRPDANFAMNLLNDAADAVKEPWEVELVAFLRVCKTEVKAKLEKRAQEFADRLDAALDEKGLFRGQRKKYLKDLRKLCCMFEILPSSFMLTPTFDECGTTPFATGGFSEVYEATLEGRRVVVKVLKIPNTETIDSVRKLFVKEVVGWKWHRHENILPFVGVSSKPPLFSIVSERMENGNIMNFIKEYPNHNRLRLLAGAVTGLEYLHEHEIVHGDLKGANILIDSECRARLADFGLAVVIDESTTGGAASDRELKGTTRWMAPELLLPEEFGFTGELLKQLPSMSTDIYAIGMAILEVLTGCRPFNNSPNTYNVMYRVISGNRPNRPASGFSDALWESLVETWVAEDGPGSKRRPSASVVLYRLKKDVEHWGKSILPLVPEEWQGSATGSYGGTGRAEVDPPDSPRTTPTIPHPYTLPVDQDETIRRGPLSPGIADRLKELFWPS